MYNYPYGDNQQINLNWIISEIIALHQRLDPDYTAPTFTQIYPFSETQQLNLDWILTELKALKELAPTPAPTNVIDEVGQALIAGAYDADTQYQKNDYIVQDGKLYRANAATTGTFDQTKWREVMLGDDLAIITRWADATNTYLNNLSASNVSNDSSVAGDTVKDALGNLNGAITSEATARQNAIDALPTSRLKGKKIAIYADSWGNPSYGSLGKDYLEDLTGETIHLSWQGSQTMAQLYTNCWDSYNADIYIINGGLNDFGNNGTINVYKTAISNFVTAMRTVNTNCEIYFITPEFIRTSTQQTQLYPLEAYRSAIWGLKNLYKYNVVNSLKWVNISYQSDNVHPLATDADTIGAYIASALINYGDEETHITEFTTLGNLKSNQLILYMIGGSPYLYFQQFTATANSTDRYPIDITALSYDMGFFQLCAMNGQTGDPAIVYHIITDVNYINVYSKGVGTGNTIAVNGLLVPTYFRSLTMPGTF